MALSKNQVNLLASGLASSRTKSGLTKVQNPKAIRTPQEPKREERPGLLQDIGQRAVGVAKLGGQFVGAVAGYVGEEIKEIPGEINRLATDVFPTMYEYQAQMFGKELNIGGKLSEIRENNRQIEANNKAIDQAYSDFQAGLIDKEEFRSQLRDASIAGKQIVDRSSEIVKETDPWRAAEDIADTGLLMLSIFGTGVKAGAEVGKATAKGTAKTTFISNVNKSLEKSLSKLPGGYVDRLLTSAPKPSIQGATKQLAESTGELVSKRVTSQLVKEVGKDTANLTKVAANKLFIKYPLTYHQVFDDAKTIYLDTLDGNLGGAGLIATIDALALLGGPIEAMVKGSKKLGLTLQRATFGTDSMWDQLSRRGVNQNPYELGEFVNSLKKTDPARYDNAVNGWMRSVEAMNLHMTKQSGSSAADIIQKWYAQSGVDISKMTGKEIFEGIEKYGKTLDALHKDIRRGLVADIDLSKLNSVTLGRWDRTVRNNVANAIENAGTKQGALDFIKAAQDNQAPWTHNDTLMSEIMQLVNKIDDKGLTGVKKTISEDLSRFKTADEFVENVRYGKTVKAVQDGRGGYVTQEELQPVKEGYERFYRGEGKKVKHGEVWDEQSMSVPKGAKKGDSFWLTKDLKYAEYYRETYGADAKIYVVDLPTGIAKQDERFANEYFVNTSELKRLYEEAKNSLSKADAFKDVARQIKAIDAQKAVGTGFSKKTTKLLADNGYVPIIPKYANSRFIDAEKAGQITSDVIEDAAQTFKPLPGLEQVGKLLQQAGLSPEDTTYTLNKMLVENFEANLTGVKVASVGDNKGIWVKNKLNKFMEQQPQYIGRTLPAQDARLLTTNEVAKALGVSKDVAREVKQALYQSYKDMPMAVRGLGDKIVDYAYSAPILGAFQRSYSRIQGALRYSWNPFFRIQEMAETEILGQALIGGKIPQGLGTNKMINMFFKQTGKNIDDTVKLLEDARVFKGTLGGEAAQDVVFGRISANLTKTQKRSLAGFTLKMAKQKGVTVQELVYDNVDEVADALKVIVQYPSKSPLNSPLAKTINLAFFPARYNLKVAGLAAKALANQPPAVQLAVVNGLFDFKDWLKTDEGILWQSENQDAIRVMKWLTPYGSIEQVLKTLNGNTPDSIGELGQLGGLPFGLIPQMIDSQSESFELSTPYMDLKTGRVYPDYIPQSTKARLIVATQDLLNQLFTYPGRTLGLPGKGELIRNVTEVFVDADGKEYKIVMPEDGEFTETQKRQMQVLEENGIRKTTSYKTYDYVDDGVAWNDAGYFYPLELETIEKIKGQTTVEEPERRAVPTKSQVKRSNSSSRQPASERVARPIERR